MNILQIKVQELAYLIRHSNDNFYKTSRIQEVLLLLQL